MAKINVKFIHPTDHSEAEASPDENVTAEQTINTLIAQNFMQDTPGGYTLRVKGGTEIKGNQTLASGGAKDGSEIRVINATDAG
jgi:hypothetical protein